MMKMNAIPVAAPEDFANVAVINPNPTLHSEKIKTKMNATARVLISLAMLAGS
jgi:hypothetical protein